MQDEFAAEHPPVPGSAAVGMEPERPSHDLRDEDLLALLTDFYARVEQDALVAPYFADVDMMAHMPRIVDFWSTLIFHTGRYTGNAFQPHLSMSGLTAAHFDRWLHALAVTVDTHAAGPAAEHMKSLAGRIALSMQMRLGIAPAEP